MVFAGVVALLGGFVVLAYIPNRVRWNRNLRRDTWRPTEATVVKVLAAAAGLLILGCILVWLGH